VATGPAYQELGRSLTFPESSRSINSFQAFARTLEEVRSAGAASAFSANDFESVVFRQHPQLLKIRAKLSKLGPEGVRMTGSGSAIFALFRSVKERERARTVLVREDPGWGLIPSRLVNRSSYQRMWRRQLGDSRL
jgi:4-diphosphocytidyl-2-C-methyl-D-erythritol kinase